jgi:hypothetical protein
LMQQDSAIPLLWFGKLLKAKKYMLIISWLERTASSLGKKKFCPRHQSWNPYL